MCFNNFDFIPFTEKEKNEIDEDNIKSTILDAELEEFDPQVFEVINDNTPFRSTPIDYGMNVAKNLNELGNGNIVVQRLGDIFRGRRTWEEDLKNNNLINGDDYDLTFEISAYF